MGAIPLPGFDPGQTAVFDRDIALLRAINDDAVQQALDHLAQGNDPTVVTVYLAAALCDAMGIAPNDPGYNAVRMLTVLHVDLALQRRGGV